MKEKLLNIQTELKAPKNQTNKFGGYKYRSCEDILEAVKPLLKKYKTTLTIEDSIEMIGEHLFLKINCNYKRLWIWWRINKYSLCRNERT